MAYTRGISKAEYWAMRGEFYFSDMEDISSTPETAVDDDRGEYFECYRGHARCIRCGGYRVAISF